MKTLFSALSVVLGLASPVASQTFSETFEEAFQSSGLIAMGVGVQMGASPAEIFVAGETAKGSGVPVASTDAWHVGSITKSFTAALVLTQVEAGLYTLDTPLAELLPSATQLSPDWGALTLTEILSHTAGLPDNPTKAEMMASYRGLTSVQDVLSAHWEKTLPHPRGEFLYSNIGYMLAAEVAAQAEGRAWADLIDDHFATPLGLTSLGLGAPERIWGHQRRWGVLKHAIDPTESPSDNPPILNAAGRLHMSLPDLLTWGRFLLDACEGKSTRMGAEVCAKMMTPVQDGYGFALYRNQMPGLEGTFFEHNGSNTFWFAILILYPEKDLVAAIVANEARAQAVLTAFQSLLPAWVAQQP